MRGATGWAWSPMRNGVGVEPRGTTQPSRRESVQARQPASRHAAGIAPERRRRPRAETTDSR